MVPMARADSTITTRRTFLASAASVALAAPATAAVSGDAELIELSARLDRVTLAINAAAERGDDPEAQAIYREGKAIFDQIWELSATTLEGAAAKAHALFWIHGDDGEVWDCKFCFQLVEELLAMTAPAGA